MSLGSCKGRFSTQILGPLDLWHYEIFISVFLFFLILNTDHTPGNRKSSGNTEMKRTQFLCLRSSQCMVGVSRLLVQMIIMHSVQRCMRGWSMISAGLSHLGDAACLQSQPLLPAPIFLCYLELPVCEKCILFLSTTVSYFLSYFVFHCWRLVDGGWRWLWALKVNSRGLLIRIRYCCYCDYRDLLRGSHVSGSVWSVLLVCFEQSPPSNAFANPVCGWQNRGSERLEMTCLHLHR